MTAASNMTASMESYYGKGYWFTKHYLSIMILVIAIFSSLPLLAPVLMKLGATGPARSIYNMYSFACHQLAFRSWFLFGEQAIYPLEAAHIHDVHPYEQYMNNVTQQVERPTNLSDEATVQFMARLFVGDEHMGYKIGLCERCLAIYWALLLGALLFAIPAVRGHLRNVPWWLYVLLGLVPIGIDGVSQLLSYPMPPLWNTGLWAVRETTPLFRTITGALFGIMAAWLTFPQLEESAHGTLLQYKAAWRVQREHQARMDAIRDQLEHNATPSAES